MSGWEDIRAGVTRRRPDYVEVMKRAIEKAEGFPFEGIAEKLEKAF